jgi:GntR family transcriptional regulator
VRIAVSNSSAVPMYEQIRRQFQDAIYSGEIAEGSLLPSLRHLAAELRVSVITVTRAYNELVAVGLVSNEHGRGFVVCRIDAAVAAAVLAERVERAVADVVDAGLAARLGLAEITRKVETEWSNRT